MIVIVCGLPGSGKSYFAQELTKRIDGYYLNSDLVRREMFPVRKYSEVEKEVVYHAILKQTKVALRNWRIVVVDATFYKKSIREKFLDEIAQLDDIKWIEVVADEMLIRERLIKARSDSEADYAVYLKIKEQWEPLEIEHLVLESSRDNIEAMLEEALHFLKISNDRL